MGRYEDLLAQARGGDETAFDALEQEFGVSTLRDKAENAAALEKKLQTAMPLLRKARLDELVSKMPEDLRELPLDVGDFGEFDPDDLTLETVQEKAKAKSESTQAAKLAHAQEAGFDSLEEYNTALEAAKQQKATKVAGMEAIGGGAASSGGEPPGGQEPSNREAAKSAFEASKKSGETDDVAMARSIDAILSAEALRAGLVEE